MSIDEKAFEGALNAVIEKFGEGHHISTETLKHLCGSYEAAKETHQPVGISSEEAYRIAAKHYPDKGMLDALKTEGYKIVRREYSDD